jgi:aryl-alcohol dehydrogenase-like predicted oxidoreductase
MTQPGESLAPLGLGCWAFGGGYWHNQNHSDSVRTIHAALREGIRHFDTAQGYGKGVSEQILGQQLRRFSKTHPRESYVLATKVFLPDSEDDLERLINRSLHRLITPYVDILYIHWPDSSKPLGPYLEKLAQLQKQGLFRALGVSNFTADLLHEANSIVKISYCQIPVSLLWLKSLTTLEPICRSAGIELIGYSPLGLGLLSGRYRLQESLDAQDLRRRLFVFKEPYYQYYLQLISTLEQNAREVGISAALLALLWARMQPVYTLLTGARTKDQLYSTLSSSSLQVPYKELAAVEQAAKLLAEQIPPEEDNLFFHRW